MKKRVFLRLAILLVPVFLISAGLVEPGLAASKQKVINLRFSCPFVKAEPPAVIADRFMDLVEERTEGRVKFKRFYSESLAKHHEHIQLVSSGSADLVTAVAVLLGRELVLNQLPDFPLYGSNQLAIERIEEITMKIPETKAIFEKEQKRLGIKILYWNCTGATEVLTKHKVTTLAELNGKKINMWAPADVPIWKEFGMHAVPIFIADFYESLSRGVLDCLFFPSPGSYHLKLFEQAKANLTVGHGDASVPIMFNRKVWDKLPGDIQEIMMKTSREVAYWSVEFANGGMQHVHQKFKDAGLYVAPAPEEERKKLFEAIMTHLFEKSWMEQCRKAGVGEEAEVLAKYWRNIAWGK